ncbi:hypothetical protein ZHAS_00017901 [Anopheles sinensis]|uniref:Uncharacterized protein n=1 Tax=Anopheles sinensis TaxID=74873 RepID=A0A084WI31_ANOSI|nr:hypothetical protein ZHAS_00017901 [Anopheles sinensis]
MSLFIIYLKLNHLKQLSPDSRGLARSLTLPLPLARRSLRHPERHGRNGPGNGSRIAASTLRYCFTRAELHARVAGRNVQYQKLISMHPSSLLGAFGLAQTQLQDQIFPLMTSARWQNAFAELVVVDVVVVVQLAQPKFDIVC